MSSLQAASARESRVLGLAVERAPESLAGLSAAACALAAGATVVGLVGWPAWLVGWPGLLWAAPLLPLVVFARRHHWRQMELLGLSIILVQIVGQIFSALGWVQPPWWIFGLTAVSAAAGGLGIAALARRLRAERRRAAEEASRAAYSDPVTGLPSRQVGRIFLDREFAMARRGEQLAVVLFHLEGLEGIGRRHGDRLVEQVLTKFGELLAETTRQMDFVGRFGEDTVLALLRDEAPRGAATFAERIREKAAGFQFELSDGSQVNSDVVVSAGVAGYTDSMDDAVDLVEAARQAVNRAREEGGGRVVVVGRERASPTVGS